MDIFTYNFIGYVAIGFCALSWGNWCRTGFFYRGGFQKATSPLLWTILMLNVLIYFEL